VEEEGSVEEGSEEGASGVSVYGFHVYCFIPRGASCGSCRILALAVYRGFQPMASDAFLGGWSNTLYLFTL
jgi:hypothetical protein